MNAPEISLLVTTVALVIFRGWTGWKSGAPTEVRHLLVNLFGTFVAIRYWQPWTETVSGSVTFDPRWIALGTFLVLYGFGALVAAFVINLKAQAYQSVKPDHIGRALGVVAGVATGLLMAACLLWLMLVATPGKFDGVVQIRNLTSRPLQIVQAIESAVGVDPASPARTRHPVVTLTQVLADPAAGPSPDGAILMIQRGKITWQP